jgi:hypothetical protein
MYKLFGITLGIIGTALWFMPLGEFQVSALRYAMSLNGKAVSDLSTLSYGVPVSMMLFAASVHMHQGQLQVACAIIGAACTAVIYAKLGGGYTPAFVALSVVSALCVVLSLANAARSHRSGVVNKSEA